MTDVEKLFGDDLFEAVTEFNKQEQPNDAGSDLTTYTDLEELFDYVQGFEKGFKEFTQARGLGTYEFVEQFGGEGQGDQYYWIYKHTSPDGEITHAKILAYYDSWGGVNEDYIDIVEVKPVEVMRTEWQEV